MAEVARVVKAVSYPKATTKKILVSLADKGAVALHRHDYAASLSPADRKLTVRRQDGQGRWDYYGAVSVMKKNPNASQSTQWEKLWSNYIAALKALDKPIKGANARAARMRLGKAEKAIERFDREAYEKFVVGRNPGGVHLPGLPAIAQREYEDILKSSKAAGRYKGREKEVAARTVRKQYGKNPVMMAAALLSIANSLKVKNPYTDLVIKGSAKRVAEGWQIGKKVFPWGRGAMQVKPHVWLDKSTGFYYVKKERNMATRFRDLKIGDTFTFPGAGFSYVCTKTSARGYEWTQGGQTLKSKVGTINVEVVKRQGNKARRKNIAGFKDADGIFHPIRSGVEQTSSGVRRKSKKKYKPSAVGEKRTYAKKRKPAKKKAAKRSAKKTVKTVKSRKAAPKRSASKRRNPGNPEDYSIWSLPLLKGYRKQVAAHLKWLEGGKETKAASVVRARLAGVDRALAARKRKPKRANPRKIADPTLVERYKIGKAIISIRSTPDGKYTASWTIQGVPGYQTGISPSGLNQYQRRKFNTIAEAKAAVADYNRNPGGRGKKIKRRKVGSIWVETRGTTQGRNKYVVLLSTSTNRDLGEQMAESYDKKQAEWEARMLRKQIKDGRVKVNPGRALTGKDRKRSPSEVTFRQHAHLWYSQGMSSAQVVAKLKGYGFTAAEAKRIAKAARGPARYAHRLGRNPTASQIRKTFAGRHKKNSTLYFPDGTPQGIAKLGKLIKIKLKRGHPIALSNPAGEVWLCCDENYKLHLGSTINAPLFHGPARDLGEVKEIEYLEAKPHLGYPKTIWFHHMGEEGGARPHLHVTKKGELKFKGGDYRITSRGIEN